MRKAHILIYIFLFALFTTPFWAAPYTNANASFVLLPQAIKDSILSIKVDSTTVRDSMAIDTAAQRKGMLDAIIEYSAKDSIVMTGDNWGYLYGDAKVDYTELSLKAERISMNMDSSIATATYAVDTAGTEIGFPIFTDHGSDYEAKSMRYNFKTKKMFVHGVITEQGEGFVTASIAKKTDDDAFFMKGGRYTTCDDHDCPHFYLALTKAKVRPKKNVVTGPAYLVIEGLPIPFIGLPFGFFPFSDKYSSGVIMPTFGDELDRGFYLRDGGYYFAINEKIDLALRGEIYTKGSWGLNAHSNYKKRYKFSGTFDIGYLVTKLGDKNLPDYSLSKDTKITWTHMQDPKADMFRTLSASVNYSTSTYDRNQMNSLYNPNIGTQNNKSSSVNLTQRFPNSPWSVSATMNVDQRSQDSTIAMTLPNMSIAMSRIYPFKRKKAVGSEKWFEKIQFSYRGEFRNSIQTKDDLLFKSNFQRDWKKGMKHSIPVSATFNLFNYLNITPQFNYTERWYTDKVTEKWNGQAHVANDTTFGFYRIFDFDFNLGLQTKMYGFYKPLFDKKSTIRHVFTPSVTFSYAPDFGAPSYGYYDSYEFIDSNGNQQTHTYSLFKTGMFSTPSQGKRGTINFAFDNNIEMKREMNDTIKKISLIDNLNTSFNYNIMADSMKWSDISMRARFKLSKSFTVNLNATFDPYLYDLIEGQNGGAPRLNRIDKMRIAKNGSFGRMSSVNTSISHSINQDTFKKLFGKDTGDDKGKKKRQEGDNPLDDYGFDDDFLDDDLANDSKDKKGSLHDKKKEAGEYDADGYLRTDVKWSLNFSYGIRYQYDQSKIDIKAKEYKYKLVQDFSLSGNIQPTQNWNLSFNTTYDFDQKKFPYFNCNISRDLHCFTLTAGVIMGQMKSYFVSLRASSSMLQDLKYDKRGRSSSYDPAWD